MQLAGRVLGPASCPKLSLALPLRFEPSRLLAFPYVEGNDG